MGAICTSWMRFKRSEPPRTFSNYFLTETSNHNLPCVRGTLNSDPVLEQARQSLSVLSSLVKDFALYLNDNFD